MEQGIDLLGTLEALKKQVADEKSRLDYILKGAELLASMLATAAKQNETTERQNIEHSESGLSPESSRPERNTI